VNDQKVSLNMPDALLQYQFLDKLKALPFVEAIWLFGSRARGDNQNRADIDLAIICPNATNTDWGHVMNIIDHADTLLKIDCIRLEKESISNVLWENIVKDKKVIYVKNANQA